MLLFIGIKRTFRIVPFKIKSQLHLYYYKIYKGNSSVEYRCIIINNHILIHRQILIHIWMLASNEDDPTQFLSFNLTIIINECLLSLSI